MRQPSTVIVGIDCAVDPNKVGLALGVLEGEHLRVSIAEPGSRTRGIVDRVVEWLPRDQPALIALDAPLGWPEAMGTILSEHTAGGGIHCQPNHLFRRATDRYIKASTGQQPLDVGADRIARTAVAALTLLNGIRSAIQCPIPLAWSPSVPALSAIEVYPAATLRAHRLPNSGYKDSQSAHRNIRGQIIRGLPDWVEIIDSRPLLENADVLDAVVCCMAGADFLLGHCMPPEDSTLAHKEGWIWVPKILA